MTDKPTVGHRFQVTVSDPHHTSVAARKAQLSKHINVKGEADKDKAHAKAKKFYQEKGYKVHNVEHHSALTESYFEELSEANKLNLFVYTKDGERKKAKTEAEAAYWRAYSKPGKTKAEPVKSGPDLKKIADIVQHEVANAYPDSDGLDFIFSKMKKTMGIDEDRAYDLINKAVKAHLGVKDFDKYIKNFKEL